MIKNSVLIVDDEAIVRESIRDWLKDAGYQVATAETGEEALQLIEEQDFSVIFITNQNNIKHILKNNIKQCSLCGNIFISNKSTTKNHYCGCHLGGQYSTEVRAFLRYEQMKKGHQ